MEDTAGTIPKSEPSAMITKPKALPTPTKKCGNEKPASGKPRATLLATDVAICHSRWCNPSTSPKHPQKEIAKRARSEDANLKKVKKSLRVNCPHMAVIESGRKWGQNSLILLAYMRMTLKS